MTETGGEYKGRKGKDPVYFRTRILLRGIPGKVGVDNGAVKDMEWTSWKRERKDRGWQR